MHPIHAPSLSLSMIHVRRLTGMLDLIQVKTVCAGHTRPEIVHMDVVDHLKLGPTSETGPMGSWSSAIL